MIMRAVARWGLHLLVVAGLGLAGSACNRSPGGGTATPVSPATLPPIGAGSQVSAEGKVVPARHAALSFPVAGRVTKVLVHEGDQVRAGQLLMQLESARQAAGVLQAEADLAAAEAQLAKVESGATPQELAAAEAAVTSAKAGVSTARGALAAAQASLNKTKAGATLDEQAIAQRRVEEAKNALWGAQSRRDSICGRVPHYADQADCDGARAAVQQAEEEERIAELDLVAMLKGGRPEDVAAAKGVEQQAVGQLRAAEAGVQAAQANLDRLEAGATDSDLAGARAQVDQAQSALEQAQVQLDDTQLRAPFAGTVASVTPAAGEMVSPGAVAVQLGDQSSWQVETQDLTEVNVGSVKVGDAVMITADAIPGLNLPGKVTRISPLGENRLGDVVYTVVIQPDSFDPRLRWNMTTAVVIQTATPTP
jgi:HlyD family secretion protein